MYAVLTKFIIEPNMDPVSASLAGVIVGAFVGHALQYLFNKRMRDNLWRRESLEKQLNELYRPLYEKCVIMPDVDPEHYFADWDSEEFRNWLAIALHIIIPKLHLAPNEILEKVHLLREKTSGSDYDTEKDVRLLFKHIDERFRYLRKELKIS